MNVVVMAAVMAVMWLLFHGRNHHAPDPEPGHHKVQPDKQPAPPKAHPVAKPSGRSDREPEPRPDRLEDHSAQPEKTK
jgi:hypothetical protein